VTNGGEPATWHDVARVVFEAAGAPELLSPCTSAEYPTPARRPAYGVLDTAHLERETAVTLPAWRESLMRFLERLRGEFDG
jgi:dTDP-4-dehydrorhamnose reductase